MSTSDAQSTLAKIFGLKDPTRKTFNLNPERDYKLYIDRSGSDIERLTSWLGEDRAVATVEGDFGTGKTHLLRYIEHEIAPKVNRAPIFVEISGFKKTSGFERIHEIVIEPLLTKVEAALYAWCGARINASEDCNFWLPDSLRNKLPQDMLKAIDALIRPRQLINNTANSQEREKQQAQALTARAWLRGSRVLTPAKAFREGYTSMLWEHGPAMAVLLYRVLGAIYKQHQINLGTSNKLLLIIDETESFSQITDSSAQSSIASWLRGLVDESNQELGLVLGLNLPGRAIHRSKIIKEEIYSRLADRRIDLTPLLNEDEQQRFVEAVWEKLAEDKTQRPFLLNSDAQRLIYSRMSQLRSLFGTSEHLPVTPRDLLKIISVIGERAVTLNLDHKTLITKEHILSWFGLGVLDVLDSSRPRP